MGYARRREYAQRPAIANGFHSYQCLIEETRDDPGIVMHMPSWPNIGPIYDRGPCTNAMWYGNPVFTDRWVSNHDIQLYGRFRTKVAGSSFNMGVMIGEGREALRMISQNCVNLVLAFNAVKRGNLATAWQILHRGRHWDVRQRLVDRGSVASNWLQLQYGWLPLLSDIKAGAEFLAHTIDQNHPGVMRRKASLIVIGDVKPSSPICKVNGGSKLEHCKQIIAYITNVNYPKLLGLTNPASVAWELLPYSFVADWVIPIGGWLDACALHNALEGTFIVTETVKRLSYGQGLADGQDTQAAWLNDTGLTRHLTVTVDRKIYSELPGISLPKVKPLSEIPSWKRAANAVALVINAFGGSRLGTRI